MTYVCLFTYCILRTQSRVEMQVLYIHSILVPTRFPAFRRNVCVCVYGSWCVGVSVVSVCLCLCQGAPDRIIPT